MGETVQRSFERIEKKYLLTREQYEQISQGMRPWMTADRYSRYTIGNLYYDTEDFRLIRASLQKPVYKEKIRARSYGVPGDQGPVFVELKKKFQGVVYKRRAVLGAETAARYLDGGVEPHLEDPTAAQICREITWSLRRWRPRARAYIAYDREAWQGTEDPELRITFDTGLRGRDRDLDLRLGDGGDPILPPDRVLMEVKIPGAAPLWMAELFSGLGVFPTSFSKYGVWYKQQILGQDGIPAVPERTVRERRERERVPALWERGEILYA